MPVLILDFDGTVCIGDGPVWAYADAVLRRIDDGKAAVDIRRRLADVLDGRPGACRFPDGYAAVAALTADLLTGEARQEAYRESRTALAAGLTSGVQAPDGLHEFLTDLGESARRVLVTNAPLDGVKETLSSLGLTDVIDSVHPDSNKPAGFPALLTSLAEGRDPALLMSVGDVYDNDIAPAYEFGTATAYIDRWNQRAGPAHLRAATLPELYPALRAWAEDPHAFPSVNPQPHQQGNPS